YAQQIEEVHADVTYYYKMAKGRFELYSIVGEIHGSGFLLAYCLMNTSEVMNLFRQNYS
ncbi:8339_t:CDS:1, partial [Paraglomus brasilianum]